MYKEAGNIEGLRASAIGTTGRYPLSGLVTSGRQLSLFDHSNKEAWLLVVMDRVRDRFGKDKVQRAP